MTNFRRNLGTGRARAYALSGSLCLVLAGIGALVATSVGRAGSQAGTTASGEPPLTSIITVSTVQSDPLVQFTLSPPAGAPALPAQAALNAAWTSEGAEGAPTSASAEFGLLDWPNLSQASVPVWLFTYYPATCVRSHGPGSFAS